MVTRLRSRLIQLAVALSALLLAMALGYLAPPVGETAVGYGAKIACSSHFVSGRSLEQILARELSAWDFIAIALDETRQRVHSSLAWFEATAVYRPGIGCTLVEGVESDELQSRRLELVPVPVLDNLQVARSPGVQALVDEYLASTELYTRALIVARDGEILGEGYGDGWRPEMPHQGWSMAKSLLQTLIGLLVARRQLDPAALAPVPEWQAADDPRGDITLDQMLRMSDGLDFREFYLPPSDVTTMLFDSHSAAAYTAAQPLRDAPDSRWNYSSGTANLLARIYADRTRAMGSDPINFARRELFAPLGMSSALIEPDASDNPVGSSFAFATARDWLRLGLLYLGDGLWEGRRILPPGWVNYARTPTPLSQGRYGALWWLNDPQGEGHRPFPAMPADSYWASGFEGQYLFVLPSHNLVVVRLGYTNSTNSAGLNDWMARVLTLLDQEASPGD